MKCDVTILGAGMHPWCRGSVDPMSYALHAAQRALEDAGLAWSQIDSVVGAASTRLGAPGFVAGAWIAHQLGIHAAEVTTASASCVSGAHALSIACSRIAADASRVALVVGVDAPAPGLLAPPVGDRPFDVDSIRFQLGFSNPGYLGLRARRRAHAHGTTEHDLTLVRVKNSSHGSLNPYARYRRKLSASEIEASPVIADPLRLLHVASTSHGAAALVIAKPGAVARLHEPQPRIRAVTCALAGDALEEVCLPQLSLYVGESQSRVPHRSRIASGAYEESGVAPEDVRVAEVYDVSSVTELDWYEGLGFCAAGDAESLLRTGATGLGGAIPVNPSGGLGSLGEATAAQSIAQVCELTWQLRGTAGARQVEGARVGIAAAEGAFGQTAVTVLVN